MRVHRFKLFDEALGDWVVQLSKCSEDSIKALGGKIIPYTVEDVDARALDENGRYDPRSGN